MKKITKYLLLSISLFVCIFLTGCIDKDDPMYIMYSYAEQNGYDGSYSNWKDDYENKKLEFRLVNNDIEWKLTSSSSWDELYELTGSAPSWYDLLVDGDLGWELSQNYSIIFNSNCDTEVERQVLPEGSVGVIPETITKENYVFNGWFYGDDLFDFDEVLTQGVVLEADWLIDGIIFNDFELVDNKYTMTVSNSVESIDLADYLESETSWSFGASTVLTLEEGINTITVTNGAVDSNGVSSYTVEVKRLYMFTFSYVLEFDNRENSTIEVQVEEGDKLVKPNLDVAGYTYTEELNGYSYDDIVIGEHVIVVTYTAIEYTITFDVDGGKEVESLDISFEETITLPTTTKARHEFLGWTLNNELVDMNAFVYSTTSDITLVASWQQNEFYVDFVANGGVLPEDNPTGYDRNNLELEIFDATRVGYTFVGWFDEDGTLFTNIPANSEVDYVLTAKWEANTYTVTFNVDGGEAIGTFDVEFDSVYALPITTKTDVVFAGWELDGVNYASGIWTIAEDVTLTAKWIICDFSITYVLNGGINNNQNPYGFDRDEVVTLNDATKVGYTFVGWFYDVELTESYDNTKYENVTLYASFDANKYTITFDVNGGLELSANTLVVTFDDMFYLPITAKSKNKFIGWKLDGKLLSEGTWTIDGNVTLVAYFEETDFEVTYVIFDGINSLENTLGYDDGDEYNLFDATAKDGYSFAGWYTDEELENEISGITSSTTGNLVLYAKYTPNEYNIIYNMNGGDDIENTIVTFDADFELTIPTRNGFNFVRWTLNDNEFTNGVWTSLEDLEVKAVWDIITYTITFVLNDGDNNANNVIEGLDYAEYTWEDEVIFENATRQLDTFDGWEVNGSIVTGIPSGSYGDVVATATFTSAIFNLNYILNDGTIVNNNVLTYSFDDGEVVLSRPTKDGFYFSYWSIDQEGEYDATVLTQELLKELISINVDMYAIYTNDPIEDIYFDSVDHNGVAQTFIYFGYYPQTVVDDSELISNLNLVTKTNTNGYIELDGVEYAKVQGNFSGLYNFSNGETVVQNATYYFKVELIKWRVISDEDGSIQVLSEFILDNSQFNITLDDNAETGMFANNYSESLHREYLNDYFLNKAFTNKKQDAISVSTVVNSEKANYTLSDNTEFLSDDTFDKIYSLSFNDATNTDYGFTNTHSFDDTREAIVTDYAIANNCALDNIETSVGYWWLRSPVSTTSKVFAINNLCSIQSADVTNTKIGIRPAFTFA